MRRRIIYYKNQNGRDFISEFIEAQQVKAQVKIAWVFDYIQNSLVLSDSYFKKLRNSRDIWEIRIQFNKNVFRFLGFFYNEYITILNHAFIKKTQKTPIKEIKTAQSRREDFYEQIR